MQIKFKIILSVVLLTFMSGCFSDDDGIKHVNVVFKENIRDGESDYANVRLIKGSILCTLPKPPIRVEIWLKFDGWYDATDYKGKEYTANSEINKDITLYARWSIFNSDNIDVSADVTEQEVTYSNVDRYTYTCGNSVLTYVDNAIDTCNEDVSVSFYVDNYGVVNELLLNKCDLVLDFAPVVYESMIDTDKVFSGWTTSLDSSGSSILEDTAVERLTVSDYRVYAELIDK